jgi:hypothetical protein
MVNALRDLRNENNVLTKKYTPPEETEKKEEPENVKWFKVKVLNELNEAWYVMLSNGESKHPTIISRNTQEDLYELIRVAYRHNIMDHIIIPGIVRVVQLDKYTPNSDHLV